MLGDKERVILEEASYDLAGDYDYQRAASQAIDSLLAEHDRLAAEVERLNPLAEVGEAVERGIEIGAGDHCLRALSITHQREGAMDGAYRVFGYRVSGSGKIDPAGKRGGDGLTLEAALAAAGLMEVNGGAV